MAHRRRVRRASAPGVGLPRAVHRDAAHQDQAHAVRAVARRLDAPTPAWPTACATRSRAGRRRPEADRVAEARDDRLAARQMAPEFLGRSGEQVGLETSSSGWPVTPAGSRAAERTMARTRTPRSSSWVSTRPPVRPVPPRSRMVGGDVMRAPSRRPAVGAAEAARDQPDGQDHLLHAHRRVEDARDRRVGVAGDRQQEAGDQHQRERRSRPHTESQRGTRLERRAASRA